MIAAAAAVVGVSMILLAVSGRIGWAGWLGTWLLGAAYVGSLGGDAVEPWAPAVAVGLYVVVELCDIASTTPRSRRVIEARLLHTLFVGCVAGVAGSLLLVAGASSAPGGLLPVVVSALCGIGVLWGLVAVQAARRGP